MSSALEPDTIMKYQDKVYILDAKYYKYGITDDPNDLPNTSSIQKQITYAKHMESMKEYESSKIFNAFILPYNGDEGEYVLKFVAVGKAGWEDYRTVENYAYVLGVLLDTRHLITTFSKHNLIEVERMADIIETSLEDYKKIQLPN